MLLGKLDVGGIPRKLVVRFWCRGVPVMNASINVSILVSLLIATILPALSSANDILSYSTSVPAEQAQRLNADLNIDWTLPDDAYTKSVLGVGDLSGDSIKQYIASRIHYVVGEKEDMRQNLVLLQNNYSYPNPGVMPDFEKPAELPPPPVTAPPPPKPDHVPMVVMSNVGTGFYFLGKGNGALVGYHFISDSQNIVVPVKSPYAGILKIGAGLFAINMRNPDVNAVSNSIFRISTLMHESHHGDGNSKSLGFAHAICPPGTVYFNMNACDRNSNGPYTVDALFVRQARLKCQADQKCNAAEAEMLAIVATDSFSRVLNLRVLDPKPEGL
jgi:hypothetical protein